MPHSNKVRSALSTRASPPNARPRDPATPGTPLNVSTPAYHREPPVELFVLPAEQRESEKIKNKKEKGRVARKSRLPRRIGSKVWRQEKKPGGEMC